MLEGLTIVYSSGILVIFALITFSIMGWFSRRKLIGKHVFITGGSKGIGLAVAEQCVKEGCHVSIVSRNESDLAAAVDQLRHLSDTLAPKLSTKLPGFKQRITSISADICNKDKVSICWFGKTENSITHLQPLQQFSLTCHQHPSPLSFSSPLRPPPPPSKTLYSSN